MRRFLCYIFALSSIASLQAQTEPDGPRLKDLLDTTQLGVRLQEGDSSKDGYSGGDTVSYRTVFEREFNSGTVTSYPAWSAWAPGPNQFNIATTNAGINYLESIGSTQMIHLLLAVDQYFPQWFKDGAFTNDELDTMLSNWVETIITSNDNDTKVEVWNLTNEILNFGSSSYQSADKNKWLQLGWEDDQSGLTGSAAPNDQHPVLFRKVFNYARQHTQNKLELRENNSTLKGHSKSTALYQLARHLIKTDVPIDAVGIQGHQDLDTYYDWTRLRDNIFDYKKLGLELYITEIDIGDKALAWNDSKADEQGRLYYNMVRAALQGGSEYIHIWGMKDGDDSGWRSGERPLLFGNDYEIKPAYYGVQDALQAGNRLKVKAKGGIGGEKLELLIDDVVVSKWWLSKDWADYSYPWFAASANVKLRISGSLEFGAFDKPVSIEKIILYDQVALAENAASSSGQTGLQSFDCGDTIDFGTLHPPSNLPSRIQGLVAESRADGIQLDWEEHASSDFRGYNVYRSFQIDGIFQRLNDAPIQSPTFHDERPQMFQETHYYVTAQNQDSHESPIASITATRSSSNSTPYQNTPSHIPGRIELENYDEGANGDAYYDTSSGNSGDGPRSDDVDATASGAIGWVSSGEWLTFTTNVTPGNYSLSVNATTPNDNSRVRAYLDNELLGELTIANTGSYGNYAINTLPFLTIPEGAAQRRLRVEFVDGAVNFDWIEFAPTTGTPTEVSLQNLEQNQSFQKPDEISLNASATLDPADIVSIAFYADDHLLGQTSESPFHFSWSAPPCGQFSISAVATDTSGKETRSDPVLIEIKAETLMNYQIWAQTRLADEAQDLPTHDPDADGHDNQTEYAFGTNPLAKSDYPQPTTFAPTQSYLEISYVRRKLQQTEDLDWTYLKSQDLNDWQPAQAGPDYTETTTPISEERETVNVQTESSTHFLKIRAELKSPL